MANLDLSLDELQKMPRVVAGTYLMWRRGFDMSQHLSKSSFYRHRKILLTFDVDISIIHPYPERNNVVPVQRVIEAVPVAVPDWAYERGLIIK